MYFLAIVTPETINQKVLKWKLWMKEHYNCEVALRSPAHITLIPPFWMKSELENDLIHSLNEFSKKENSFPVQLKDLSNFKPRVIYVNVLENDQLNSIKNKLSTFFLAENKFPLAIDDHPFHPHVTIATRDLHKKAFYEAWEYFKDKKYDAEWNAEGISLLRHNKKNWGVIFTSQFQKS